MKSIKMYTCSQFTEEEAVINGKTKTAVTGVHHITFGKPHSLGTTSVFDGAYKKYSCLLNSLFPTLDFIWLFRLFFFFFFRQQRPPPHTHTVFLSVGYLSYFRGG